MKLRELHFQALRAFRKHTKDDENSKKLRNAIIHSNHKDQKFTTIKYDCEIDVDWVENIEEGLIYVEKAINEDRQFIRTEGEVLPIEKIKRVSKESIRHLASHSNFITRLPENKNDTVVPEKLYMVEKLSDYLVYENRFLYLLLRYVKDFIEIRLNKIRDKTTTYQSHLAIDKDIEETNRNIKYKLEYSDLYRSDPLLKQRFDDIPLVNRVETAYAVAVSLLARPLMKACAKAPLIKPPITKTNVLRMNQNFKASLKLYDYITSYSGEGYEIVEVKKTFQPLTPEMSDEIAETVELTSLIGYITGNDIRESMEQMVEEKEKKQKEAESKKKQDEIKRLKKRIVEMNEDPVKYIHALEKRNAELENTSMELKNEKEKNNELHTKIDDLRKEQIKFEISINNLNTLITNKDTEIDNLNQKYFDDMTDAEAIHQEELSTLRDSHNALINELKEKHNALVSELKETQLAKIQELESLFVQEKEELEKQYQLAQERIVEKYELRAVMSGKEIVKLQQDITNRDLELEEQQSVINNLEQETTKLDEEKSYANASYLALRSQQGLLTEDDNYSSKDRFKQLEAEKKAYNKFFKEQWKQAKQQIRTKAKLESSKEIEEIKSKKNKD